MLPNVNFPTTETQAIADQEADQENELSENPATLG